MIFTYENIIIFVFALIAGFIDSIAGGGGLIMMPALMTVPMPVHMVLGTNKLCGVASVLVSSIRYGRMGHWRFPVVWIMVIPIILGSWSGSHSVQYLSKAIVEPLVVIMLVLITLFVLLKHDIGKKTYTGEWSLRRKIFLAGCGFAIGFHDGFFGPGTGIFMVFALLMVAGLDFLQATGTAKILNLISNTTALIAFAHAGQVNYKAGFVGVAGIMIGSYLGTSAANLKGAKLIKPLFVLISVVLIGKIILTRLLGL